MVAKYKIGHGDFMANNQSCPKKRCADGWKLSKALAAMTNSLVRDDRKEWFGIRSCRNAAIPQTQKGPAFHRDSSNVDVALMCFGQAKTRLFRSGSKYLISCNILVAGTGFEPVTFRL